MEVVKLKNLTMKFHSTHHPQQAPFPNIVWDEEDIDDHSSSDYGYNSTSSLEDFTFMSTPESKKSTKTVKLRIDDASHHLNTLSLSQEHLQRSMAFYDLDSLVSD
jgi:hypothetical protein